MKFIVAVVAVDPKNRFSYEEGRLALDIKRGLDYMLAHRYSTELDITENSSPKLIIERIDIC